MKDNRPKIIIIISAVILLLMIIFTSIYMYNVNKDVKGMEGQIDAAKVEYEKMMQEMSVYNQEVDVDQTETHMKETLGAGKSVAKLQNEATAYYREHVKPEDSEWADTYKGDKDTLASMKKLFPEASSNLTVLPWVKEWTCTWSFSPFFDYSEGGSELFWACRDSDGRLLAVASAQYHVDTHSFTDLEIITTKHFDDADRK